MKVDDLDPEKLRAWHRGIVRGDSRASRASANRLLTMFKACLKSQLQGREDWQR